MQLKVSGGPQFSCLFLAACSGSTHQLELFEATGAWGGNYWNSVWLVCFSLSLVSSELEGRKDQAVCICVCGLPRT